MAFDPDEIRFGSAVVKFVEDELKGSISGDAGEKILKKLWADFRASLPADRDVWIQQHASPLFPAIGARPTWLEPIPEWPYHGGLPMLFIHQTDVPSFSFNEGRKVDDSRMYVFAAAEPDNSLGTGKGHWKLITNVVFQYKD